MFVGTILENGNFAFECLDGGIVECVKVIDVNNEIIEAYSFEGKNGLLSSKFIGDIGDMYKKSEDMSVSELYIYLLSKIYNDKKG